MVVKRFICLFIITMLLLSFSLIGFAKETPSALKNVTNEISGTAGDFKLDYDSEDDMFNDMKISCENASYAMYIHEPSLTVGIVEKESGFRFLTNPYNAAKDPYYAGEIGESLDSQIIISYIDSQNSIKKFYSSSDCVKLGKYSLKYFENGISINFSIGEENEQLICPEVFLKSDFEKLLGKMDSFDAEKIEYFYRYVDMKSSEDDEIDELRSKYPFAKNKEIYILTELNNREQKILDKALRSVGYDNSRYQKDMAKYNLKAAGDSTPNIKLTLEYCLTDKGLTVTIPKESVSFNEDVCYLQSIDVLPYFGADSEETGKDGYLFIPDGSGAIINFADQQDTRRRIITNRVYGYDKALNTENYKNEGKQYYLPVYGIVRNNKSAVFSVIESGDTLSEITARLGSPNSNYYSVYNTFLYTTIEKVKMDSKVSSMNSAKEIYLNDKNVSEDDFRISYYFLTGDNANYCYMADLYRRDLTSKGMKEKEFSNRLNIETLGTALYEDTFLGFTYKSEAKLTKYSDNISIIKYFNEAGIDDITLTLSGWQKNGLDGSLTNKLNFSSALGGKSDYKKLQDKCDDMSVQLYLGTDLSGIKYNRLFDGFIKKRDNSKRIDGKYANLSIYDVTTQKFLKDGYLLSPTHYQKYFNSFVKSALKNAVKNINLRNLGTQLNSDFDSAKQINRTQTKESIIKMLKNKKETDFAFDGSNAYILPFAKQITNIPLECSNYPGESNSVPFLQLVLSGCVEVVSQPINLSGNSKSMILKCISYGVSPNYVLAYRNVELLKSTDYTEYYAVSFETLKESVAEDYKYFEKALTAVKNAHLVNHQIIASGILLSEFSNGKTLVVNIGNEDYQYNGVNISAESYAVL